jgi:hypothetical protein
MGGKPRQQDAVGELSGHPFEFATTHATEACMHTA